MSELFDERNDAVKGLLSMAIQAVKRHGKYVGICGQAVRPRRLRRVADGAGCIDSLSLTRTPWCRPINLSKKK
ncbi:hypothetical protein M8494_12910 [Serratia ureilytica]